MHMLGDGKMMPLMEKDIISLRKTEVSILANGPKDRKMEEENKSIQMAIIMRDNSGTIRWKEKEFL